MMPRILFAMAGVVALGILSLAIFSHGTNAAPNAVVNATITISVCGNGAIEGGEECDGAALGGQSCAGRGFTTGTLSCRPDCTFNTSQCTSQQSTSSGGGGGGGGGASAGATNTTTLTPLPTTVTISGTAFRFASIVILKDGQIMAATSADDEGFFQAALTGLSGGNYILGIYAQDAKGNRSPLLTVPLSVTGGTATTISDVVVPGATISSPVPSQRSGGDVNGDGKVNLVDFSVSAYWYRRASPPPSIDANGDGVVNLIDLSIMAFYWTG
jgi:hypothetical protein